MKPEEAIKILDRMKDKPQTTIVESVAIWIAVDALKKQIPVKSKRIDKNAEFDGNWKKVCPACGRVLMERITTPEQSYQRHYNMTGYCYCGQKIYWSEDE